MPPKLGFARRESAKTARAKLSFAEIAFPSATWERAKIYEVQPIADKVDELINALRR